MTPDELRVYMKKSESNNFLVARIMGRLGCTSIEQMEADHAEDYKGMCDAILAMEAELPPEDADRMRLGM